jgi:hypothetical protein
LGTALVRAGSTGDSRRPGGRSQCRCIAEDMCRWCRCSGNRRAPDRTGRGRTYPGSRHSLPPYSRKPDWCTCRQCRGLTRSTRSHPRSYCPHRCSNSGRCRTRSSRTPSARRQRRIGHRSGTDRRGRPCHGAHRSQTDRGGRPQAARHPRPARAPGVAASQIVRTSGSRCRIAARPQHVPFLRRFTRLLSYHLRC